MNTTAVVDLVCAVFIGILFASHFSERGLSKSSRLLNLCLAFMLATLLIDAAAYTFVGPSYALAFRFLINFLSFALSCVNVILFTYYTEALLNENGAGNLWFFRVLKLFEYIWLLATAYEFIAGHLITYDADGFENINYVFPTYIVVMNLVVHFMLITVTAANFRRLGGKMALLMCLISLTPALASVLYNYAGIDFAYALGAVMLGFVAEFVQKKQTLKLRQEQAVTKSLAEQQRYMKAFGDMVNAALWNIEVNDADEITVVNWSDEVRRMLRYDPSAGELPDTVEAWQAKVHPDDLLRVRKHLYESIKSRDTENFVYDSQYRLSRKDGEYRWYHAVGRMEALGSGSRRLYGILFDITPEKQLEERQEKLDEALESVSFETKCNDVLTDIISGAKFTYDISADDEVIGAHYTQAVIDRLGEEYASAPMGWVEFLHPEDKEAVRSAFMASVRDHSGNTPYSVTFRMLGRDGSCRYVRSGGNVIRRADGSGELFGITLDITDQIEEQQQRLRDEEERRRAKQVENELVVSKLRADSLAYIEDNEASMSRLPRTASSRLRQSLTKESGITTLS